MIEVGEGEGKYAQYEQMLTQHPSDYAGVINEWIDEGFSGAMFSHYRDSDILDESNWKAIVEIMSRWIDGDEGAVRTTMSNHWAVGWIESMHVKIRNKHGKFTKPFKAAIAIKERLDNYPVLDEESYSLMEWEDLQEYLESVVDEEHVEALARWLYENYSVARSDDVQYKWIEEWTAEQR